MTVSSQINKIIYIGNGVAKEFAIPFSFLEQKHIKVEQKLENVQAERTDWSVKDGNLVFENAPESGAEIAIVREVPLTQETDYRDNEILHAETLERNFDKLTMQVQQLAEKSARAVTVDIFDDTAADSLIPSIRKAVSDCADYATTAKNKAQEALTQAQTAADQAQSATASATNAALSETNTAAMLGTKADVGLDNLTEQGKEKIIYCLIPDYSSEIVLPSAQNDYTFLFSAMMRWSADAGSSLKLTLTRNGTVQTLFDTGTYNGKPDIDSISALFKKGDCIHFANNPHIKHIYPLIGETE